MGLTQLVRIAQNMKNQDSLDPVQKSASDIDGNGSIGITDLVKSAGYLQRFDKTELAAMPDAVAIEPKPAPSSTPTSKPTPKPVPSSTATWTPPCPECATPAPTTGYPYPCIPDAWVEEGDIPECPTPTPSTTVQAAE